MEDMDYLRFIHNIFEFNDTAPAGKPYVPLSIKHTNKSPEVRLPEIQRKPRQLLVDVLAFCLMPNHFHFLLQQRRENGISEFMRKMGTGYTNFFNQKYQRSGSLFQGVYKRIQLTEQAHFLFLPYYIHLNPLDLIMPEWREGYIENTRSAFQFLDSYRWSSYPDYINKKNFPSVTQRSFLQDMLGSKPEQEQNIVEWIQRNKLEDIEHLILESPEV